MKQIADYLRNLRTQKGLTEKDILDKTTLTLPVIHLIEKGEFKSIGAEFYVKNFLKQYCNVIGLTDSETEEIIAKILKEFGKKPAKILPPEQKKGNKGLIIGIIVIVLIAFLGIKLFKSDSSHGKEKQVQKTTNSYTNYEAQKQIDKNQLKNINTQSSEQKQQLMQVKKKSELKDENPVSDKQSVKVEKPANQPERNRFAQKDYKGYQLKFEANCMCWINVSYNGEVIKDFILKEGESYTLNNVPPDAVINIGDTSCLKLFVNGKEIDFPKENKVLKDFRPEL